MTARLSLQVLIAVGLIGLTLGGAAEEAETEADEAADPLEFPPEIQKLLTEPSEQGEYAELERCISTRSLRRTYILDNRHIVFQTSGSSYYLVQFPRRCPRLMKNSTLIYENPDGRLCKMDMIRPSNGSGDVSPPCSIPGFIPITKEQMVLLRDTLEAQKAAAKG